MARLDFNAQGGLEAEWFTRELDARRPRPGQPGGHPNAVGFYRFDEGTNPALVADLKAHRNLYTVVAGVLLKNGLPVTVNPPGPSFNDWQELTSLDDDIAALAGIQPPLQAILRRCLIRQRHVLRKLRERA